jgi:hypothetical protein
MGDGEHLPMTVPLPVYAAETLTTRENLDGTRERESITRRQLVDASPR